MPTDYRPRIADVLLAKKLAGKGAVLIEGPKWCGKTTTAEQIAKSVLYMTQPGQIEQHLNLAQINPQLLLQGDKPRLIDEWQIAPQLWDTIRFEVDHTPGLGQFILTGSSVPADMTQVLHSGTGRFAWLRMRPMSLWESGDSNGNVSFASLFDPSAKVEGVNTVDLNRIAYLTCRGGWPASVEMPEEIALEQAFDYVDAVEQRDISLVDSVSKDPTRVHKLLRSLARHQGTQASVQTIKTDIENYDGGNLNENTISSYIKALRQIFVVDDVEAWNPNLRSKTAIRTSDTRYFTDPSIAVAAMGMGPNDLLNDLETFGLFFETLCIRDLRTYVEPLNGKIYHFRNKNGLECDAVAHLRDGRYGLIEIKLGGDRLIADGIKSLKAIANQIDTEKMKRPSFMMVLTATGSYAYRNEEGIAIVPVGCLKD